MESTLNAWTEQQWKKWEEGHTCISLDELNAFHSALDLLRRGARLSKTEREGWIPLYNKIGLQLAQHGNTISLLTE